MKQIIIILQAILQELKELLEKQLNNIRAKKDSIIKEANKELELFKKFQIAAQANPKLTYVDFCNNIKNKEV